MKFELDTYAGIYLAVLSPHDEFDYGSTQTVADTKRQLQASLC
jgi:hypothetical protein